MHYNSCYGILGQKLQNSIAFSCTVNLYLEPSISIDIYKSLSIYIYIESPFIVMPPLLIYLTFTSIQ
jgi:hypothetical protein